MGTCLPRENAETPPGACSWPRGPGHCPAPHEHPALAGGVQGQGSPQVWEGEPEKQGQVGLQKREWAVLGEGPGGRGGSGAPLNPLTPGAGSRRPEEQETRFHICDPDPAPQDTGNPQDPE